LLDIYCERTTAGLWNEPLNLVTNAAFLLAALAATRNLQRARLSFSSSWDLWLLILLLAAIGVGSGLWHSYATGWAALADVLPITLFMAVYLLSFLGRVVQSSIAAMLGWLLLFESVNLALPTLVPADWLDGSLFYLPAAASLVLMWIYCRRHRPDLAGHFRVAVLLFGVSLTARTIDNPICSIWPIGTHFVWHLLNAELLRRLIVTLLSARRVNAVTSAPD
jgi:hypothetical protein